MISFEIARKRISGLDSEKIRELVKNRLLGTDTTSLGSGHSTEPSEDLVIQLLSDPDQDDVTRETVIAGCEDVYGNLLGWLAGADYEEKISHWQDVVTRISRVVDVTGPQELMGHANSIMRLALQRADKIPEVFGATVRACMGYKDRSMLPVWESIINKYADVAAYAFNAILNINPKSNKIEMYLKSLWRQQVTNDWPVDTAFLLRRSARLKGEKDLIYRAILSLKKEGYWDKVEKILKEKPWSAKWLEKVTDWKLSKELVLDKKEIKATSKTGKKLKERYYQTFYREGIGHGAYYQILVWKSAYFDNSSQDLIRKHIFETYEKEEMSSGIDHIELSEEIQNVRE